MVLASAPKTSPNIHTKKRHGQHHKVSKHYSKTYWPYLPMLLIIGLGFVLNSVWSSPNKVLSYATNASITDLLQETNNQRVQQGVGALALNNQLSQAAQTKATDMATRDYWAHVTPDGKQPWQFMSDAGYAYVLAGENLAYGFDTSAATIAGWMNSPSHRENLLRDGYKDVGFGIANSPNFQGTGPETIIVAEYASPQPVAVHNAAPAVKASPAPVATPTPAATPAPATETPAAPVTTPTPAAAPAQAALKTTTATPVTAAADTQNLQAQKVSRLDVLTDGNGQWATLVASVLITLAVISLVYRHGKMWRRYLVHGEDFLLHHPLYDTFIVAAAVIAVLLTRTSGFIR